MSKKRSRYDHPLSPCDRLANRHSVSRKQVKSALIARPGEPITSGALTRTSWLLPGEARPAFITSETFGHHIEQRAVDETWKATRMRAELK